ncbi:MAG: thioesterase-like protein [Rhodospirillales bacterium]|nr:MAG: thioesterase-like protein [Rhodospirillales bacterium]
MPGATDETAEAPAPLSLHREAVRQEWLDYNGHMNVAFYVLVFDHASDAVLDHVDLGTAYRERSTGSVFVTEAHVTYEQEASAGDVLRIESRILGFDGKRFILYHEMFLGDGDAVISANEVMCLHVDLTTRRTAPIPPAAAHRLERLSAAHACLPRPLRAGRAISLGSRRPGTA